MHPLLPGGRPVCQAQAQQHCSLPEALQQSLKTLMGSSSSAGSSNDTGICNAVRAGKQQAFL